MYENLRSQNVLSYDVVEKMFEDHQDKWPEAIFNEDSMFKYIDPLIEDGTGTYLAMLQGSKEEQRKWWLSNRFKYLDSKYNAGSAASDVIQLRGYAKSNITVKPYADIYASIKYGSYLQQTRANRGQEYTIVCPLDNVNDTEIYIYSASQLASIGDVSGLKVGLADFSKATRLQDVKVGDADPNYTNENLGAGKNALTFGNNTLLKTIDARNCINLGTGDQKSIDISHCSNIEEVYFDGTKIQGLQLPNGGVLRKLHLPATITNLTILNQKKLTEFVLPSYENISSLRLENNSDLLDTKAILKLIPENTRVRIIGFYWECENTDEIDDIIATLNKMRGLDEQGNNMDTAQVSGTIHTSSLTGDRLAYYKEHYPYLNVTADHTVATLRYYNYNGTVLIHEETIYDGGNGTYNESVARDADAQYIYTFVGWSKSMNSFTTDADAKGNVVADRNIYAAYRTTVQKYTVTFVNGSTVLQTNTNVPYGSSVKYIGTTPTYTGTDIGDYIFSGWNPDPSFIVGNTECIAQYIDTSSNIAKYLKDTLIEYESDKDTEIIDYAFDGSTKVKSIISSATNIYSSFKSSLTLLSSSLEYIEFTSPEKLTFKSEYFSETAKAMVLRTNYLPSIIDEDKYSWAANSFWRNSSFGKLQAAIYIKEDLVDEMRMHKYFGGFHILPLSEYDLNKTDFSSIKDTWEQIIASTQDGSYLTKYKIGDTKKLDINNYTYYMELIAFDTDELSDGTGYAHTTWLAKASGEKHRMNNTSTNDGGWGECELRGYMNDTLLDTIEDTVKQNIKEVKKTYRLYNGTTGSCNDYLWIPSVGELYRGNSIRYETEGCTYETFANLRFSGKRSSNGDMANALTRSAHTNTTSYYFIDNDMFRSASATSTNYEILPGFCI